MRALKMDSPLAPDGQISQKPPFDLKEANPTSSQEADMFVNFRRVLARHYVPGLPIACYILIVWQTTLLNSMADIVQRLLNRPKPPPLSSSYFGNLTTEFSPPTKE
jgi:hypothetical protein